jgi:TetR/AcrR family transcriptional regulator, transcriptional repressor for nem operon
MATTEPATEKGRATRRRIVQAAAAVVAERGAAGMSLDEVRERSGASKSQLYHYFEDRADLIRAVVDATSNAVLSFQDAHLAELDSFAAIDEWFDAMVRVQVARHAIGGCPIGSLVGQLAERDEGAREALVDGFDRWEGALRDGLERMRVRGELRDSADTAALANATMASIQGGLLLTQVRRDPEQLRSALGGARAMLRASAVSSR